MFVLATPLLPLVLVSPGAQEAGMDGRHQGRVPAFCIFHTHPLVFSYRKEQMQIDLVYNIQHTLPHFLEAHSKLMWALPGGRCVPWFKQHLRLTELGKR